MNPQQVHNKSVKRNLFPKQEEYFLNLFTEEGFRMFLETNATTREGVLLVASRYSVKKVWEHWLSGTDWDDYARDNFMLLKSSRFLAITTICGSVSLKVYINMQQL